MSKPNKSTPEPDTVDDKLRDSLKIEDNKPDTVNADLGSPITPLQTRASGLTSAATTTTTSSSCSSSSSGSVTGRVGHAPVTRKPDSDRSNPSTAQSKPSIPSAAAQSASSNLAGVQLKSSATSAAKSSKSAAAQSSKPTAAQSPKSTAPSAAQSSKTTPPSTAQIKSGDKPSKSTSPSAAQPGSSNPAGAKIGSSSSIPKTAGGNLRRSASADSALKQTGKSTTPPQQPVKIIPAGNLFPSGKVQITGMSNSTTQKNQKSMVLATGAATNTKSYGYGNIMRGNSVSPPVKPTTTSSSSASSFSGPFQVVSKRFTGDSDVTETTWRQMMNSTNPDDLKRSGNEMFKKGCFNDALRLYDRALELSPSNATCHSNRGAALTGLGRIGEAVIECEKAINLDPNFTRAHHRLGTLLLRLGQVDSAGKHFFSKEEPSDPMVVKVLEMVDKHLFKCTEARRRGDWNIVLNEVCAAMVSGADLSPQLSMCKVEALLKLVRIDDAQTVLAFVPKVDPFPVCISHTRLFDMICEAYMLFVKSQMELALGRFENAVTAAEKASEMDPRNSEIESFYRNVRLIAKARDRGNDLYESERYTEAGAAYAEGLKFDPYNAPLLSLRADCFFKVGMWESSIEDCDHALLIHPSYIKAYRQRAASYCKLEQWLEAVRDYEFLRQELPYDKEIAESLFHAQVALKKSHGEVVLNMEFGGEVEEISSFQEFRAALTRPGTTIVHFMRAADQQCKEMCVFMDTLCIRYPSIHFLKVEIEKCPAVNDKEKVRVVPTIKIFRLGIRIKEIVCPSKEALENSVRNYVA